VIEFPSTPVVGDTYTFNGRTWEWNGSGWERQLNQGQLVAVFTSPGPLVLAEAPAFAGVTLDTWAEIDYV